MENKLQPTVATEIEHYQKQKCCRNLLLECAFQNDWASFEVRLVPNEAFDFHMIHRTAKANEHESKQNDCKLRRTINLS